VSSGREKFFLIGEKSRFHRRFSHFVQMSAGIFITGEGLRSARNHRTQSTPDNPGGGGAYTQN
jgi:hypothetical protein